MTYGYDTLGRRVWRKVDGTFDKGWLYDDSGRPFGEVNSAGDLVPQGQAVALNRFIYAGARSIPTYMIRDGKTYLFVHELNGTVRMLVDAATGQVVQRLEYSPLGKVKSDTNPGFQPFGYASGLYDPDTGLMRMGSRGYDPEVGRWLARDPSSFGGGDLNLFVYCANDGISRFDPDGHSPIFVLGLIIAGAALLTPMVQWPLYVESSNEIAQNLRPNLSHFDAENAMRHCVGQCAYASVWGDTLPTLVGHWHENPDIPTSVDLPILGSIPIFGGGPENAPGGEQYSDRLKDEYNNICGRENAKSSENCLTACGRDLVNNRLATDTNLSTLVSSGRLN